MSNNWGYSNDLIGPEEWPKYFRTGQHQSPINILVDNCEQAASQSTCCQQLDRHQQNKSAPTHEARQLHDRLRDTLQVSGHRRAHLNSTGEDHHRSSSTSSSGSQNSFSPNNRYNSNTSSDCDDEDNNNNNNQAEVQEKAAKASHNKHGERKQYCPSDALEVQRDNKQRAGGTCCLTQVQNTRHCVSRKKIFLGYPRYLNTMQICNTGHNWQVNLPPELANHTRKLRKTLLD